MMSRRSTPDVTAVRLLAASIVRGSTVRAECIACGETTMTVTHKDDGRIAYQCKRASCGVSGYADGIPSYAPPQAQPVMHVTGYEFRGRLEILRPEDDEYFLERFGFVPRPSQARLAIDRDAYAFSVRSPAGLMRGWVIRQPRWAGIRCPRAGDPSEPKTKEYIPGGVPLAWYVHYGPSPENLPLIIVEDQVSAMACHSAGFDAVSLLGTYATLAMADEIGRWAARHDRRAVVAFDEDATGTAYKFAAGYGQLFRTLRVQPLQRDLKDEVTITNIRRALQEG